MTAPEKEASRMRWEPLTKKVALTAGVGFQRPTCSECEVVDDEMS